MGKQAVLIPEIQNNNYDFCELIGRLCNIKTGTTHNTDKHKPFTFIDLFAGIGGFHLAAAQNGGKCVFACEIDESARQTYIQNHNIDKKLFATDITKVNPVEIPDHDLLCAGFPCQPFSQCGFKKGFEDVRGTLFFYIADIIDKRRPRAFFLENVRHLLKHNNGQTITRIQEILEDLGYSFDYKVIQASEFGLPQHRPRLFMVGFRDADRHKGFIFPEKEPLGLTMSDIMGGVCNKKIGFTLRVGGKGSKINDRRNWDGYIVDGNERRLTPKEGLRMMGFPDSFMLPESRQQAMKQLGNSVAVPAIKKTIESILNHLHEKGQN